MRIRNFAKFKLQLYCNNKDQLKYSINPKIILS